jgi:hypothetical protein
LISSICRSRYGLQAAALHGIGDIHVLAPLETDRGQHAVEQFSGLADEGFAALVFFGARPLADEQPVGMDVADAEYRLLARLAESALAARRDGSGKFIPSHRHGCGRSRDHRCT